MPFISEVASIFIQRFYTGWITLRNQVTTPIRIMGRRVVELYDALITGNDWEITPALSLKRRAGHTNYVQLPHPAMAMYSWKSSAYGTIPIVDTTQELVYIASFFGGPNSANTFAAKGVGSGRNLQSSILGIGNYLYIGNSQLTFKWDGPAGAQGKTNWGIAISQTSTSANCTTGSQIGSGGGLANWNNPTNIANFAVSYATTTVNGGQSSWYLDASAFGFSIPAGATVAGVQISLSIFASSAVGAAATVYLVKSGGVLSGTAKTFEVFNTVATTFTLGGATDLWGTTLTPGDVNASGWGFAIAVVGNGAGITISANSGAATVFTGPAITATPTGVGSFSAVNGFTYCYAYGNATSGEISNATNLSTNTGPFTNKSFVGVTVTASSDPQVNQIRVYRTTDSGGGNQFFELPNSPFANTNATIQDTAPDTSLQVTSQAEINLGNTPPPAGIINLEWFAGRMWGSVNNLLFASTGPETLSGTAPNSNWNPTFQWVIPGVIVRNVRGPNGMLVFTQDDCYIVRGTDIVNYTVNEFVKDFGIRSYNALDTDGTNIYAFTSDRQFILMSASGAQDLGLPIADQLLNVDPTSCYVKVNRYGLDAVVRILDTVNNVFYDYNLNQQCWNLPGILQMAACTAMGSIETAPGVWRLLLTTTNSGVSKLAYRDISNFQDLGTSYQPNAVLGSIQLADPGTLAKFGGRGGIVIERTNAGTGITLTVLMNDIGATLTNAVGSQITGTFVGFNASMPIPFIPTYADPPKNYQSLYYYIQALASRVSGYVRHMQVQISAPAENTATEIIGFGIFGDQKMESESSGQVPQLQGK